MRTITSTLRAAAQSLAAQPAVQCTLHASGRRWESLDQQASATPCKVAAVWVGDTLYRYRVDASGNLQQQAIANPDAESPWATWSTLNTEPAAGMDVAVAHESGHFRLVYQDASKNIRVLEGTDGVTWGSPATLASLGANAYVAATGQDVLVLTDELDRTTRGWSGGVWASMTRLAGGPWSLVEGLAATLDTAHDRLLVLFSAEHALRWVAFDRTAGTFGTSRSLEPRGDAGTTDGASPRYPDILALDTGYMATWQSRHTGTPTWAQEIALFSPDGEHFGHEAPLRVDSALPARLALAQHATTGQIIAGHDTAVLTCNAIALDDASATTGPLTPLSYRYRVTPSAGASLTLRLLDADRSLDPLGDGGDILAPLNPIVLSRGWVTTSGAERVDLPPLYITRAERSEGQGSGVVTLEAVDALGLLNLVRPWWLAEYADRTVTWLLSEVAALAGTTCETDGDSAFSASLGTWQLDSGRPLAVALDDLLALAGAVARVDADGVIQAQAWDDSPTSVADIGDGGGAACEILGGSVGLAATTTTGVAIVGDGASVLSEDIEAGMSLGLRRLSARCDWRVTSASVAAALVSRERALAAAEACVDIVRVPLRPELELWDVVDVTLPGGVVQRRVVELEERWESGSGVYESRVGLAL